MNENLENQQRIVNKYIENRNNKNAILMRKYLRDQFEFLGIRSPIRKILQKKFLKELDKEEPINKVWVLQLWNYEYREFQYLAIDYLIKKKKTLLETDMELIELLITTKPWWDTVDIMASHLVGELCKKYPSLIKIYILKWAIHENMWLRRTAIIYQLKYKDATDTKILEYTIDENKKDNDFFIRKAIGWALREYSKSNSVWVEEFIHNNELSVLSVKEGSKYLN